MAARMHCKILTSDNESTTTMKMMMVLMVNTLVHHQVRCMLQDMVMSCDLTLSLHHLFILFHSTCFTVLVSLHYNLCTIVSYLSFIYLILFYTVLTCRFLCSHAFPVQDTVNAPSEFYLRYSPPPLYTSLKCAITCAWQGPICFLISICTLFFFNSEEVFYILLNTKSSAKSLIKYSLLQTYKQFVSTCDP